MDVWYLMFDLSGNGSASLCEFSKMLPPKDRFWADPHVIQTDDGYYIFVEEYVHRAGKAHISVIEMDSSGKARNPVRVLEEGYHLSYPSVFEWQNVFYMVPESAENRTVDLYECVEFPHRWQFKMSLMEDVQALDSTLFQYKGKWWMFTGIVEHKGAFPHVELFLFFADTLFTREWTPHPLNPVVSDVKRARPAGGLIVRNGMLFRPSQDCSRIYGYGFDLNEVVRLSETEYLEKPVVSVRPHWDRKTQATHTYARAGELTVIDAFMRSPRWFQRSLA